MVLCLMWILHVFNNVLCVFIALLLLFICIRRISRKERKMYMTWFRYRTLQTIRQSKFVYLTRWMCKTRGTDTVNRSLARFSISCYLLVLFLEYFVLNSCINYDVQWKQTWWRLTFECLYIFSHLFSLLLIGSKCSWHFCANSKISVYYKRIFVINTNTKEP